MLTRAEGAVALLSAAALVAGITTAGSLGDDRPAVKVLPAAEVVVPTVSPTPRATPSPRPRAPRRVQATPAPLPATPPRSGCPVPPRPPGGVAKPMAPPAVADAALPAPTRVRTKATDLAPVRGKGLWVTSFGKTPVDVPGLVATARSTGVRSLWVRTGGSRQGYYGDQFLGRLVPAAHAAGIAVIAWDFPFLSDPVADARRARQALDAGIDAFAPDVETGAEGTYATPRRVALYLSLVRAAAGTRPVVATVPRPTPKRLASFPYAAFVPYADVFAPMVYWSCNEPGELVQQSLTRLGRMLPVAPVGQAYDMGSDGGRVGTPSRAETLRFLDVARRGGAIGASLWTLEHAGVAQLQALHVYRWPV